ncbi:MAG: FliG C-terminal domain-containing protein [Pirellulales bacterium]
MTGGDSSTRGSDDNLRKIALVVASLEADAAAALLTQFPEPLARRVRQAVAEGGDFDPVEQQLAIADFLRQTSRPPAWDSTSPAHDSAAVELDDGLARQFATAAEDGAVAPRDDAHELQPENLQREVPGDMSGPHEVWQQLREVASCQLGACLDREHPQTIAVVLAKLPPAHAANVLAELSPDLQAEALRRLETVRLPATEVLDEIGRTLLERCAQREAEQRQRRAGEEAVAAILSAARDADRARWSRQIHGEITPIATRLPIDSSPHSHSRTGDSPLPCSDSDAIEPEEFPRRNGPVVAPTVIPLDSPEENGIAQEMGESSQARTGDDPPSAANTPGLASLLAWSDRELARLMAVADPWAVVLALAGTTPDVAQAWLARLPAAEARRVAHFLTQLGPWRLSDAVQAERDLLVVAGRLRRSAGVADETRAGERTGGTWRAS